MKVHSTASFCLTILITLLSLNTKAQQVIARDPTKPALVGVTVDKKNTDRATTNAYEVKSILIAKGRSLALVNDKFVGVGDTVGNATVIAIERNAVTLSESGRKLTVYLFERSIWN